MKKVVTVLYTIFSLIFFTALLLFAGLGIFRIYQTNYSLCAKDLEGIKSKAFLWHQGIWDTQAFHNALTQSFAKNKKLLAATVYSPSRGILLASSRKAPKTPSYLLSIVKADPAWIDPAWSGQPLYQSLPLFGAAVINLKIMDEPADDLIAEGLYAVLQYPYPELFGILKNGFIAILIWLITSIVIRLFVGAASPEPNLTTEFGPEPSDVALAQPSPNPLFPAAATAAEFTADEDEDLDLSAVVRKSVEDYEDMVQDFEQHLTGLNPELPDELPAEPAETAATQAAQPEDFREENFQRVPAGSVRNLFSPQTGIGWEEHLIPRLDAEIKRTASFDQDMSLALITIDNFQQVHDPEKVMRSVVRIILDIFLFQDLSFEYGGHGFAVILPEQDIQYAVREMQVFQRRIAGNQIRNQFITVSIGLSSRNGRLINGGQMLKETAKAQEKAALDPGNSIIAFNPDPDKYREVIARQQ